MSASSIAEDASAGDLIGTLSVTGGSGSYTFTEVSDPDSLFAIDGDDVEVDATLAVGTHSYTVEADNGVDDPIQRVFVISVTEVTEDYAPSLDFSDARNSMYSGQVA